MNKSLRAVQDDLCSEIIDIAPIRLDAITCKVLPPGFKNLCRFLESLYPFSEDALTDLLIKFQADKQELLATTQFSDEKYVRIRIHDSKDFEVLLLCWKQGQTTRIHDHAGSLCAVKILQGIGDETIYTSTGKTRRVKAVKKTSIAQGSVTVSRDSDIHSLGASNSSKDPLVSLHIYSPPLKTTLPYKEIGK